MKPGIDISIRWKLALAFVVTLAFPIAMQEARMPIWLTVLIGVPVTMAATWYASRRVIELTHRLREVISRFGRSAAANPDDDDHFKDELSDLVHSFDHLVEHLEQSYPTPAPATGDAPAKTATSGAFAAQVRHTYIASLATGEPAAGVLCLLPRRGVEDMRWASRVTGDKALAMFADACKVVREQLEKLRDGSDLAPDKLGIIDFQVLLLKDPSLTKGLDTCLADGLTLPDSLNTAFGFICTKLEASPNAYISARVPDCLDLKHHLIDALSHLANPSLADAYRGLTGKIVACHQVFPSDVILLRNAGVAGLVSVLGTPSSHAEIFLQSFNLPSISNVPGLPMERLQGCHVLLDTHHKRVITCPNEQDLKVISRAPEVRAADIITGPVLLAGQPFSVEVTINNVAVEAALARDFGADGVGLFRSEMSFIGRPDLPTEEELFREYRTLAERFAGRRLVMRMMDLGSDKLAMFQQHITEENPSMGNRSMRLLIRHPQIFRTQLRAMLRAATPETCILYPMITGWHELRIIRKLNDEVLRELAEAKIPHCAQVQYGLMVEVPGMVERFADFVEQFDVFNIGTNDLTQYTLAADRNNEEVAEYYRFFHPAIISMIRKVCRIGQEHGKVVRICGQMGADITLLPLLVGLGARNLSIPYRHIPTVKHLITRLDLHACERLAADALAAASTDDVEALLHAYHHQVASGVDTVRLQAGTPPTAIP